MYDLEDSLFITKVDAKVTNSIIDSSASFHVIPNRYWFTTCDASKKGKGILSNNDICDIVVVGDRHLNF